MQPMVTAHILLVDEPQGDEEKEDGKAADTHHDAEAPEVDRDERHEVVDVFDVSVAEILDVRHERVELRACFGRERLSRVFLSGSEFAVALQGSDGFLSALDLVLHRGLLGAVVFLVAFDEVVHARHITVERAWRG